MREILLYILTIMAAIEILLSAYWSIFKDDEVKAMRHKIEAIFFILLLVYSK